MATEYYLIINETQRGPFAFEQLAAQGLNPDMLVWRAGLPDWTRASELPELFELMNVSDPYASVNGRFGQDTNGGDGYKHNQYGLNNQSDAANPNYGNDSRNGSPDFGRNPQYGQQPNFGRNPQYGQQPNYGQNPQYGQQPNYGQNPNYGQGQQPNFGQNPQYGQQPNFGRYDYNNGGQPVRQNWLTWAIIATVAGFFFSCIGGIFGVIGIVQANKANNFYRMGYDAQGDQANNTAKIMTIIGLVLSAVGVLGTAYIFRNGGLLSLT